MDYRNGTDLLEEIRKRSKLFILEFNGIEEGQKDLLVEGVDRSPSEMIAYQLGWINLVMSWDVDEQEGKEVIMPAPGYKWNQLGGLYKSFYESYKEYTLVELKQKFNDSISKLCDWIEELTEEELFIQGHREWTGDKENWPMAKWIHINSVAPFKTFRTKIRKWKKSV